MHYNVIETPQHTAVKLSNAFSRDRKKLGYNQAEAARRAGVSLGSLKRFEQTAKISLASLLKLAHLYGRLESFDVLTEPGIDQKEIEKLFDN